MRIALIADIHGNLPALKSVLAAIRKHAPDRIVSLGDQVNLGPCPREVLAALRAENATCLHGNHERYILSAMEDHPAYQGANFRLLQYHRAVLNAEDITFAKELHIEDVTFCHAMPGDDRFPVFDTAQCLARLGQMEFEKPTHIICGHGHNPRHYSIGSLTLDCIGSAGCMDDGVPGAAPYAILDIENGRRALQPYFTQYDPSVIPHLFRESGMAAYCPIMAHINCLQMTMNIEFLVQFVALAEAIQKQKGERLITEETWAEADRRFDWPDGLSTEAFWKRF